MSDEEIVELDPEDLEDESLLLSDDIELDEDLAGEKDELDFKFGSDAE